VSRSGGVLCGPHYDNLPGRLKKRLEGRAPRHPNEPLEDSLKVAVRHIAAMEGVRFREGEV